jgi:serine/threonine protein kinase
MSVNRNPDHSVEPLYTENVQTTSQLTTYRRRRVNQFIRGEKIGKGQHGEVFLCTEESSDGKQVVSFLLVFTPCVRQLRRLLLQALKVVKRSNPRDRIKLLRRNHQQTAGERPLGNTEHSIRKEIAVMKKCRHGNIVRLFEVIDDPQHDKIYLGGSHSVVMVVYSTSCVPPNPKLV